MYPNLIFEVGLVYKRNLMKFSAYFLRLVVCLSLMIACKAFANGVGYSYGLDGGNIASDLIKTYEKFVVDEAVTLDFQSGRVWVEYEVVNGTKNAEEFYMLFPVAHLSEMFGGCKQGEMTVEKKYRIKQLDFRVELNGQKLDVSYDDDPNVYGLQGEYKKLADELCMMVWFEVNIRPGYNSLRINYKLNTTAVEPDLGVSEFEHAYLIWPAKSWVKRFRYATWRVVLPELAGNRGSYEGDWFYGTYGWTKWEYYVHAPERTIRKNRDGYIEFSATNFAPEGVINFGWKVGSRYQMPGADLCDGMNSLECVALERRWHNYDGDRACISFWSLFNIEGIDGVGEFDSEVPQIFEGIEVMQFLRNEIFARKGYIFETESLKQLFSEMPWYQPLSGEMSVNAYEKWNVKMLKTMEELVLDNPELFSREILVMTDSGNDEPDRSQIYTYSIDRYFGSKGDELAIEDKGLERMAKLYKSHMASCPDRAH